MTFHHVGIVGDSRSDTVEGHNHLFTIRVTGGEVLAGEHLSCLHTSVRRADKLRRIIVNIYYELTSISNFPALASVYTSPPLGYNWIAEWIPQIASTLVRPVHPKYSQISTIVADYFSDLLSCNKEVTDALEQMERDVKDILAGAPEEIIPGFELSVLCLTIASMIAIIVIYSRKKNK